MLVVDCHPVHRAEAVKQWLAQHREDIEILYLPPYFQLELIYKVSETLITTRIPYLTRRPIEEGFAYFTNDLLNPAKYLNCDVNFRSSLLTSDTQPSSVETTKTVASA